MASSSTQIDTVQKVTAAGSFAFGVFGVLAPNLLATTYGVKDPSSEYTFMARLWGSRNLMVGAVTAAAEPGTRRRTVFTVAAAMNGLDVVSALTAKGLPATTRLLAAATSGGFAAAALWGASAEG